MAVDFKAFDKILRVLSVDMEKARAWLVDKRLSARERKIIEGYLLIRNNKNSEVIELLGDRIEAEAPFVRAHEELLLGHAHCHIENFDRAIEHFLSAKTIFKSLSESYYLFGASFSLFLTYSNVGRTKDMSGVLEEMRLMDLENDIHRMRLLRAEFIYACDSGDEKTSLVHLESIHGLKHLLSEGDYVSHLVCEFMFYVQHSHFPLASRALEEMKAQRKFNLSDNFKFMRKLLDHYLDGKPVYTIQGQFEELPVQKYEIQVIQAFEELDLRSATEHWGKLMALVPERYLPGFHYEGAQCLFSLCLGKHLFKTQEKASVLDLHGLSLNQKLLRIFEHSDGPIAKAQVYELLWGNPPETKDDLQKLSNMVSKLRQSVDFEIQSLKGTWVIGKKKTKKSKRA